MKLKAGIVGLGLVIMSGCSSVDYVMAPDGIAYNEMVFCQHYGNLYANIAKGRDLGKSSEEMTAILDEGIRKAVMPDIMRPTMEKWAPVAVYRVYSAPGVLSQGDWRHHVETECMDRLLNEKRANGTLPASAT